KYEQAGVSLGCKTVERNARNPGPDNRDGVGDILFAGSGRSKASSRNLKATATPSSLGVLVLEPFVSPLLTPGPQGKAKGGKKLVSGSSFPSKARTQQKSVKSSTIRTSHDDQLLF